MAFRFDRVAVEPPGGRSAFRLVGQRGANDESRREYTESIKLDQMDVYRLVPSLFSFQR